MKVSQETKNKLHRLELLAAVSLVLVLFGLFFLNRIDLSKFSFPGRDGNIITGFVSSDFLTQNVDITLDESKVYEFSSDSTFVLTSLRLTGSAEGVGVVQVFFEGDDGERLLVYTNVREKTIGNLITGRAAADPSSVAIAITPTGEAVPAESGDIAGNEEVVSGPFYNECRETCFIAVPFAAGKTHRIVFSVEKGARVQVSQLSYTTG